MERIDLENLVTQNVQNEFIKDQKIFHSNLIINGCVFSIGLINNINLTNFCKHFGSKENDLELEVHGKYIVNVMNHYFFCFEF